MFLWTTRFFPMLARVCVAAKCVWQPAQKAGPTDNNFRKVPQDVDNHPVVPKLYPGLSTNPAFWTFHALVERCSETKKPRFGAGAGGLQSLQGLCGPGLLE